MGKTIRVYGFPCDVTSESVIQFLENITGKGTVCSIEVGINKPLTGIPRAYANVQFTTEKSAETIVSLTETKKNLWFGDSYLLGRVINLSISPKGTVFQHIMDDVTLHFGCQISKEKFSVLWKGENVCAKFGVGLRKIFFYLSDHGVDYKFVLPYDDIWKIELHHSRGQSTRVLLIQPVGGPRIYQKDVAAQNYVNGGNNDLWVRQTDFTPFRCIGQSSSLCLEFSSGLQLPDFREDFVFYKENEGELILERGSTFSCSLDLVPIVAPPQGIHVPYNILYKINSLVQHGYLPGPALDVKFFQFVDPSRIDSSHIESALEKLSHLKDCCYEPVKWLSKEYHQYLTSIQYLKPHTIHVDDGLVYVRRVQITPTKVYFCDPDINLSNRVLRNYPSEINNFLRVSFVDEDLEKLSSTDLSPHKSSANEERRTKIYDRVLSTLRNGIVIGDKKFEFLAFSSSQLRENSTWMFAQSGDLTASAIREWMGEFRQIRNVAKYAARLGQSFGSSREALNIPKHEVEVIPDVEVQKGEIKYVFSDGIGKISAAMAQKVATNCGLHDYTPSAFQIRYGGYKGVVAVDPTSKVKLSLRNSMSKYISYNTKLDVLACSKYQPCFLNRQLITLLSTLGVRDSVFEKKQKEAIRQLNVILTDRVKAIEALEMMSPGENTKVLKEMLNCGYKPNAEPFLSMMLQTFRSSKLLDLRTRTRIFLPNGRAMMGCLDETRTLQYGQVFVQCSGHQGDLPLMFSKSEQNNYILEGKVAVAKNPCLHPGDLRVLTAVNVPALQHMVDCVVFPQMGKRPHPNECSGSDLDGDIYYVCWDPELIPPRQIQPMDYNPVASEELDHDVTIEEVEEYFTNYIVNDRLGIIANAHTVIADKEPRMAMSDPCIELANLFSVAVDFNKTGIPAVIPHRLRVRKYPDFMEKPDKPTYKSPRVIGKLYREVKDIAPFTSSTKSFTKEVASLSYDRDMEVDGFEDFIDDAFNCKTSYDYKLGNLMDYYGIKTEAEILSGSIMKMSKSFDRRRDLEGVTLAINALKKEARGWFNEKVSASDDEDEDYAYKKASAWYHVTNHPKYWGLYNEGMQRDHFLSFPWCVYDTLIQIKKDKANTKKVLDLSSLQYKFGEFVLNRQTCY